MDYTGDGVVEFGDYLVGTSKWRPLFRRRLGVDFWIRGHSLGRGRADDIEIDNGLVLFQGFCAGLERLGGNHQVGIQPDAINGCVLSNQVRQSVGAGQVELEETHLNVLDRLGGL